MEEERNQTLKTLLKKYENKKILIVLKNNYKYKTNKIQILDNSLFFVDKFGAECVVALSEIASVQEVRDGS